MMTAWRCEKCGEHMFKHGLRDGQPVCPEPDEEGTQAMTTARDVIAEALRNAYVKRQAEHAGSIATWVNFQAGADAFIYALLSAPESVRLELLNPWRPMIERIKNRVDYRLNDYLCEMKPDYDDSITGFNEAWDIVRAIFKEELEKLPAPPLEDKT